MHEDIFCNALRPLPVCILNLPLADYSIGHEILLFRRRNALLVSSPADFSLLDFDRQIYAIREAVWICGDPASKRIQFEKPGVLGLRFRYNRFCQALWHGKIVKATPEDYALAELEFRNYWSAAHETFPVPEEKWANICAEAGGYTPMSEMTGRAYGAPYMARLFDFVVSNNLHKLHGFKSPYDVPYALANNIHAVRLETEGRMWIENYYERQEKEDFAVELARFKKAMAHEKTTPKNKKPDVTKSGLATNVPEELKETPEQARGRTADLFAPQSVNTISIQPNQ